VGGTIRGYRVFSSCRTVNRKIFRLDDHIGRLFHSAAAIHMQPPLSPGSLKTLLEDLLAKNVAAHGGDFRLDIIFSGGLQDDSMKMTGRGAHLYIGVHRLAPPPEEVYEKGVALATFPHQRAWPDIKLLNYVGAVIAHQTVVPAHNAFDVMFVDPSDGKTLLEGSTFTVFFVDASGGVVTTPLDGRILDSITRRALLEMLASSSDIKVCERPVTLDELPMMSEAFLASTTRSVVPVVRMNEVIIGDGTPGPVTKRVMELFRAYLESY
jgi:branched-chain amino acid aminotransferase